MVFIFTDDGQRLLVAGFGEPWTVDLNTTEVGASMTGFDGLMLFRWQQSFVAWRFVSVLEVGNIKYRSGWWCFPVS